MMFYDVFILLLSIYRNSYKAVIKNGELEDVENGYLIVTHNIVTNSPLNLSINEQKTHYYVPHSDTDSGFTYIPLNQTKITTPLSTSSRESLRRSRWRPMMSQ